MVRNYSLSINRLKECFETSKADDVKASLLIFMASLTYGEVPPREASNKAMYSVRCAFRELGNTPKSARAKAGDVVKHVSNKIRQGEAREIDWKADPKTLAPQIIANRNQRIEIMKKDLGL